ncbi:MAG TPA: hypothetical protein EYP23_02460 [Thermoplasmata archaeon]|nr:hypothetical protein [Thermoplasmata archaeon]
MKTWDSYNNTISNCKITTNSCGIKMINSSYNLTYNNYFNNINNTYISGRRNNIWNTSKTLGKNIIGGDYLGGNYWSDYNGVDTNLPHHGGIGCH